MKLELSRQIKKKRIILNFVNIRLVRNELFHAEVWTGRRTEVTKVTVAYINFSNACVNG